MTIIIIIIFASEEEHTLPAQLPQTEHTRPRPLVDNLFRGHKIAKDDFKKEGPSMTNCA